jgi:hypothetical protein
MRLRCSLLWREVLASSCDGRSRARSRSHHPLTGVYSPLRFLAALLGMRPSRRAAESSPGAQVSPARQLWPPSDIMSKMLGERPPANFEGQDFSQGRHFEVDILDRLGSSVHRPSSSPSSSFLLLAVFHRSSFHLIEDSMGMVLSSVLDSSLGGFHLACVKPCHFRFLVASKVVGFFLRALKRVTTRHFDVYFHLWQDGGANWN